MRPPQESWWRRRESRHGTSPVATAALGRLLTAGAMMGSMMKNDTDVLTLQINGDGPLGGITVTADSQRRCERIRAEPGRDPASQEREAGCGRSRGHWPSHGHQRHGAQRALLRSDYPRDQRDRGGSDLLFCQIQSRCPPLWGWACSWRKTIL